MSRIRGQKSLKKGKKPTKTSHVHCTFCDLHAQVEIKGIFCFTLPRSLLAGFRVRVIGSSTLALCHLASGAADAYYQFGLHCWDLAAATVIIREAGGTVIDTSGEQNILVFVDFLGTEWLFLGNLCYLNTVLVLWLCLILSSIP